MSEQLSEILRDISREFGVPAPSEDANAWLIRADGGDYYDDYRINNYIAIGWNEVPTELILNNEKTPEEKNDEINELLPEASRPGLVRGQLETFLTGMKKGDFVATPNYGGKRIYLGVLTDNAYSEITKISGGGMFDVVYKKSPYIRRRAVHWLKEISPQNDIYLVRIMRAHQTISNITENIDVLMRNLYDIYFRDGRISLTLRYRSERPLNFNTQYALMSAIKDIETVMGARVDHRLFKAAALEMKMSVSSPGFFEIITSSPYGFGIILVIMLLFGAKFKYSPGTFEGETDGIPGILGAISDFADRWQERKMKKKLHAIDIEDKKVDLAIKKGQLWSLAEKDTHMIEEAKTSLNEVKVLQEIDTPEIPDSINF